MDISNLVFLLLHFQSEAVRSHFRFLYRDSMPPDRILCSSPAHHYRNSISPEAPEVQEEIDIDHTLRKLPVRIWQSQALYSFDPSLHICTQSGISTKSHPSWTDLS